MVILHVFRNQELWQRVTTILSPRNIYENVVCAMDIFSPIFKKSNGVDTAPFRQVYIGPL